jgi:acyl-coenzyme A thioesterase PaaI-like protein
VTGSHALPHDYEHGLVHLTPPGERWARLSGGGPFFDLIGPHFARYDGLEPDEPVRVGMRLELKHCNARHVAHGGFLTAMFDNALAQALLVACKVDWNIPTINLVTDFLAPALENDWLETRMRVSHTSRRMAFLGGEIRSARSPVLRGQAIFRIKLLDD